MLIIFVFSKFLLFPSKLCLQILFSKIQIESWFTIVDITTSEGTTTGDLISYYWNKKSRKLKINQTLKSSHIFFRARCYIWTRITLTQ